MLSDDNKLRVERATRSMIDMAGSVDEAARFAPPPSRIIDRAIEIGLQIGETAATENLRDNRAEAERMIAGMLGLM